MDGLEAGNFFIMVLASICLPIVLQAAQHRHAEPKLKVKELVIGKGPKAKPGDIVTVDYKGSLTSGKVFDSSIAFKFHLGAGEVIKGWDLGVAGMKVGGKRKLTIPPALGYGDRDMGAIPPNSTLIFTVKLLRVETTAK